MGLINVTAFCLGVIAYSISQLIMHGKLRWSEEPDDFWGVKSWLRKYKMPLEPAPNNWYYKIVGARHKERWPTSTWITVNFTDGYHACQSVMFVLFSVSLSIGTGLNFFIVWGSVLVLNFLTYRLLQK